MKENTQETYQKWLDIEEEWLNREIASGRERRRWIEEGIAIYQLLLYYKPDEVRLKYSLAQLLLDEGTHEKTKNMDRQRAREILQQVLKINPDHGEAQYHLGFLYFYERNYEKAIHYFNRALMIGRLKKKQEIRSLISLSISYSKVGNHEDAWRVLEKAKQADTDHHYIPEIEMAKMQLEMPFKKPYILQSRKEKRELSREEAQSFYTESMDGRYALLNFSASSIVFSGPRDTVRIPPKEATLLKEIILSEGFHTQEWLKEKVWTKNVSSDVVRGYMNRIRRRLEGVFDIPIRDIIFSEQGRGYAWVDNIPTYVLWSEFPLDLLDELR